LEVISAPLVLSEISINLRQNLQHSLELDLILGGNSNIISLYKLLAQFISTYLEASPVSLVDSEYNIGFNSQHRSEREFSRSGQIIVSLSSQYNNNLSTQLLSAFFEASSVYLEETEYTKNFVINLSLRAQVYCCPSPLWSNAFSRTSMNDLKTDQENERATRKDPGDQEVMRRASIEVVNKQWKEGIKDLESNRSNKKASVHFDV
jgi:hypothetical protein